MKVLGYAAAGVVLAVVSVELMPKVLMADPPWLIVLAFAAGGAFFILIDYFIGVMRALTGPGEASTAPLAAHEVGAHGLVQPAWSSALRSLLCCLSTSAD